MSNPHENASALFPVNSLEQEIKNLQKQQADAQKKIKELLFAEDIPGGVTFASEIFDLQQSKLRLDTEIQILRNRIQRLKTA